MNIFGQSIKNESKPKDNPNDVKITKNVIESPKTFQILSLVSKFSKQPNIWKLLEKMNQQDSVEILLLLIKFAI